MISESKMYTLSHNKNTILFLYGEKAVGGAKYRVGDTVDITGIALCEEHDIGEVRKFFLRSLVFKFLGAGLPIVFIAPDDKSRPYIEEMNFLRADDEWYQYPEKVTFPRECEGVAATLSRGHKT